MSLLNDVKKLAAQYAEDTVNIRRHIHANPELSFKEFETAKYVAAELRKLGIEPKEGVAGTGLTALIEGRNPASKTVALRADMDALPITEQNEVSYKSKNIGVMHACGHDVHTSCLLGAARILVQLKDQFEGTIKLVFQPGEEKNPGGASLMIKDGALENPRPNNMFGQHVMPYIPTGKVGFREGQYMASADEIYLTVKGKGGHAALPDKVIDPILIASHIIVALQQVVSRNADPKKPTVLSFGQIEGGHAQNIIPDEVKIGGTFRALDEEWRFEAHKKIRSIAEGLAEAMGGSCDVLIDVGYPYLTNDPTTTQSARAAATAYLGAENIVDLDLWMGAEDFAYYSHEVPSCFYRLGTGNSVKGTTLGVHTPKFNIDEDAIELGIGLMAWIALNQLASAQ
ncbi:N-acyl-L-amino acid amidohydrolase [Roseivirga seohaensis]|uniref:N-acyl-L-amino acid amidohydrolase n=2 Tax=Roseivirga seohaensis TaxID=1914963 RepID=A0A0L8AIX8_9BACT|nr:M20 family metallopeptidase [Roseivirga seohaensis]KOF02398.1 N-acyl-L-amino acid amidohydrolase [Roseivirga seohaensis subsp. aquiponti]KYG85442.1 N-acyl-L-amino acid amidohydrolase [Roseivirga seohaensis]